MIYEAVLRVINQLQDCIVSLIPIQRIQHFTLQLKEENIMIQTTQKLLQKIEIKKFCVEIKSIYLNYYFFDLITVYISILY